MHRYGFSWVLIILAVGVLLCYGLFESRKLILGPELRLESPSNGSATSSVVVLISGTAQNIAFLTINGSPAYTDLAGHFSEMISPVPGYNIVTVEAKDRFGRLVEKSAQFTVLDYCPVVIG